MLRLLSLLGACAAPPTSEDQLPRGGPADIWVLLVHGSGDDPSVWAEPMAERLTSRLVSPERVAMIPYDWADAAQDKLAAAGRGEAEGLAIAGVIEEEALTHVHVIAHSAGAFVAQGIADALPPDRPTLHLTFLDPFCGKGLDFGWAVDRFGANADFVDDYVHHGDGVPGTDVALTRAPTFDTTPTRPGTDEWAGSEGHWWPTEAYDAAIPGYAISYEASGGFDAAALQAAWPPGVEEALEDPSADRR